MSRMELMMLDASETDASGLLLFTRFHEVSCNHISLRVSQTDTTVVFTIQDTGPGLPADLPDMVYEPYTLPEEMPK